MTAAPTQFVVYETQMTFTVLVDLQALADFQGT